MNITPSDAIRALQNTLKSEGLFVVSSFVANDLANTRRAFEDDALFVNAILAVIRELRSALKAPATHGIELEHDLDGWRRSKFCPTGSGDASLRLVFRPIKGGMELLAFGHRDYPDSVYFTAEKRR